MFKKTANSPNTLYSCSSDYSFSLPLKSNRVPDKHIYDTLHKIRNPALQNISSSSQNQSPLSTSKYYSQTLRDENLSIIQGKGDLANRKLKQNLTRIKSTDNMYDFNVLSKRGHCSINPFFYRGKQNCQSCNNYGWNPNRLNTQTLSTLKTYNNNSLLGFQRKDGYLQEYLRDEETLREKSEKISKQPHQKEIKIELGKLSHRLPQFQGKSNQFKDAQVPDNMKIENEEEQEYSFNTYYYTDLMGNSTKLKSRGYPTVPNLDFNKKQPIKRSCSITGEQSIEITNQRLQQCQYRRNIKKLNYQNEKLRQQNTMLRKFAAMNRKEENEKSQRAQQVEIILRELQELLVEKQKIEQRNRIEIQQLKQQVGSYKETISKLCKMMEQQSGEFSIKQLLKLIKRKNEEIQTLKLQKSSQEKCFKTDLDTLMAKNKQLLTNLSDKFADIQEQFNLKINQINNLYQYCIQLSKSISIQQHTQQLQQSYLEILHIFDLVDNQSKEDMSIHPQQLVNHYHPLLLLQIKNFREDLQVLIVKINQYKANEYNAKNIKQDSLVFGVNKQLQEKNIDLQVSNSQLRNIVCEMSNLIDEQNQQIMRVQATTKATQFLNNSMINESQLQRADIELPASNSSNQH